MFVSMKSPRRNCARAPLPRALPGWICAAVLGVAPVSAAAQAWPDRVAGFSPGVSSAGTTVTFGASQMPGNVLGPPAGTGDGITPADSPLDLVTLGNGGWITLEFTRSWIVDGPGPDFTVFENPVAYRDYPGKSFVETAVVSVSENGADWTSFPFDFIPPPASSTPGVPFELYDMVQYSGFAGVRPVFASATNGISPFDPGVSGGDSFDLAAVGVARARFIRIRDAGTTGPTQTLDPDGHIVDDPGNYLFGTETAGFDLDAVAAIHTVSSLAAVRPDEWCLYE